MSALFQTATAAGLKHPFPGFPERLLPYATRRSDGDIMVNLLVNYGWQWDLLHALQRSRDEGGVAYSDLPSMLASGEISRVDLVVRWGGHRRLSGFLPIQCAYADVYVVDTLWPDSQPDDLVDALTWYQNQDVTLGG